MGTWLGLDIVIWVVMVVYLLAMICLASVLLATTSTVQGMMNKATGEDAEVWFFGILAVTTATFLIYSYLGGIVAVRKSRAREVVSSFDRITSAYV